MTTPDAPEGISAFAREGEDVLKDIRPGAPEEALREGPGTSDLFDEVLRHSARTPRGWARWPVHAGLRFLRIKLGLRQRDVAARAGMTQPQLARIERGRDVRLSTLRKVFEALGCGIHVLPYGVTEPGIAGLAREASGWRSGAPRAPGGRDRTAADGRAGHM